VRSIRLIPAIAVSILVSLTAFGQDFSTDREPFHAFAIVLTADANLRREMPIGEAVTTVADAGPAPVPVLIDAGADGLPSSISEPMPSISMSIAPVQGVWITRTVDRYAIPVAISPSPPYTGGWSGPPLPMPPQPLVLSFESSSLETIFVPLSTIQQVPEPGITSLLAIGTLAWFVSSRKRATKTKGA
jgi:hypothetical protein